MNYIATPFGFLLRVLYDVFQNYGITLIVFSIFVKLFLLPFQMKSKRSTMRMNRLSPQVKELEKRHGANQRKYQEEVQRLYKSEKINPMSGCLWNLIPLPIMLALFYAIRQPLFFMMQLTAEQVAGLTEKLTSMALFNPETAAQHPQIQIARIIHENFATTKDLVPGTTLMNIDFSFFGMDLGLTPSWNFFTKVDNWSAFSTWLPALGLFLIPVISALLALLQMRISSAFNASTGGAANEQAQKSMKSMMFVMPLMSLWIGFSFPAALSIYWLFGNMLNIIQEAWLNRRYKKILDLEDAEREERFRLRDQELEQKRLETERLRIEGATARNANTSRRKIQAEKKSREEERVAAKNAALKAERDTGKPPSQVGNRPYARGRAYSCDRYPCPGPGDESAAHEPSLPDAGQEGEDTAPGAEPPAEEKAPRSSGHDDCHDNEYDDTDDIQTP